MTQYHPTDPRLREYEAVVAGGGPAGATAATLLAQRGHRVLLAERTAHPQFKLGESLMPATYSTFERLGMLEKMKRSHFPKKMSVQFVTASGRESKPFYFFENDPHERSQTWQVLRSEFDQMLLDNAVEQGVEVCRGLSLKEGIFDGDRAVGARVKRVGGEPIEIRSQVLIDATGQSALLARRMGIRHLEPQLKNASIYTHYEGARRDEGIDEGATIIYQTESKRSWFWFIPLPGDRVSVGVVGSIDHLIRERSADPRQTFEEELDRCPLLAERLAGAQQTMPVGVIRDFSYKTGQQAGEGWVLVGDAGGFIDPVYSTGVFLALKSGEMAADAVHEAIESGDLSGERLGSFATEYRAGVEALRTLVYAFYRPDFSFARFLKRYPECRGQLVDMLVGNVYERPVDRILAALRETLAEPVAATA